MQTGEKEKKEFTEESIPVLPVVLSFATMMASDDDRTVNQRQVQPPAPYCYR